MTTAYRLRHRRRTSDEAALQYRRLRKELRNTRDPFVELTEREFVKNFRLTKDVCIELIEEIKPLLKAAQKSTAISAETKILCAIRFFSTGSFQGPVGQDIFLSMSQPSVSRCVFEVAAAICSIGNTYTKFPDEAKRRSTKVEFYQNFGIGGVIGIVDGTHISILRPKKETEHVYYAVRKACHTKNVQVVCDYDLRIISTTARFGGSAHDSFVWNNSVIKRKLQQEYEEGKRNTYILGDSGYGQQPWLLVPIKRPQNPAEEAYNAAHQKARHRVERCIGILKSRFRCLCRQRVLLSSPARAGKIINACIVLHNILMEKNYPLPAEEDIADNIDEQHEAEEPLELQQIRVEGVQIREEGVRIREQVVREYFS